MVNQKVYDPKTKSKTERLSIYYTKIKQKWIWVAFLALLFTGIEYFLQVEKTLTYSTELVFLINFDDILFLSDVKRKNARVISNRRQTRKRQRQVLDLLNDALKSQAFQANVLFKKATINGVDDFLANHIIRSQQLFITLPQQQRENWKETGLVGFKFAHGNVDSFSLKEQMAFEMLARQLPKKLLHPTANKINNGNQFIGGIQNRLVESGTANTGNSRSRRFGMPTSFSFRAKSRTQELPAIILNTVYKQLNKHFAAYHHRLLHKNKEQLKLDIGRYEKELFDKKRKVVTVRERINNISSRTSLIPLKKLEKEWKALKNDKINKKRYNLLLQLELLTLPPSPFILVHSPEPYILLPTDYKKELKALVTFSIIMGLGLFFLMIKQPAIDTIRMIGAIWAEGEKNHKKKSTLKGKEKP